jgi:hypothetical protein
MNPLNLPAINIKTEERNGKRVVFDILRKKYVVLTPEEWVRQHFVHLLIHQYNYPKSLIKVESGLSYNDLKKRSDIVVFYREGKVFMLVECKACTVTLKQSVLDQVTCYNATLKSKYIVVTNGLRHLCCSICHFSDSYTYLSDLPKFM